MENAMTTRTNGAVSVGTTRKMGMEEVSDRSDLIMPRAKLLQSNSPEIQENVTLRAGMMLNNVTQEVLPMEFIPVIKFTEWFKFNARDEKSPDYDSSYRSGAMIWRITDPHDHRVEEAKFGPNGEKPKAMKVLAFMSYFPGVPMPVVVSFANTSMKAGKKLNTMLEFSVGKAAFANKYRLKPSLVKGDKGPYWVNDVALVGPATEEEYAICLGWYQNFKGVQINAAVEETEEDCPIQ
jgi:hypothetical protein